MVSTVSVVGGWEKRRGEGKQRVSLAFGLPLPVACASKGCLGASRPLLGLLGRGKAFGRLGHIHNSSLSPHTVWHVQAESPTCMMVPHCDTSRYTASPPLSPSPPCRRVGGVGRVAVAGVKGKGNSRPGHGNASTTGVTGYQTCLLLRGVLWPSPWGG